MVAAHDQADVYVLLVLKVPQLTINILHSMQSALSSLTQHAMLFAFSGMSRRGLC